MDQDLRQRIYNPLVSIIMPVYNSEETLFESITSILTQTYSKIELIIINDGSSDKSELIIKQFDDPRIRYFLNNRNKGLVYSLNKGLEVANGEYIGRMDADDISFPNRILHELTFLENNPEYGLVGTARIVFGRGIRERVQKFPMEHDKIVGYSYLANPMVHPSFLFRRSIYSNLHICYDEKYKNLEDYQFVLRCIEAGIKLYNIPDPYIKYRISQCQISSINSSNQQSKNRILRKKWIAKFCTQNHIFATNLIDLFNELIKFPTTSPQSKEIVSNILFSIIITSKRRNKISLISKAFFKKKINLNNWVRIILHYTKIKDYSLVRLE